MSTAVVERIQPAIEFTTGDVVTLEATRHLFIAADLLDPARKADIGLPEGGEELASPCLTRLRFGLGGLLPKCEITPLEFTGVSMPQEYMPEGVRPIFLKDTPAATPVPVGEIAGGAPQFIRQHQQPFMPTYPGELIVDALGIATGERRGVVEIKVLQGVDYGGYDRELQNLFFPPDFVKPIELKLVRQRIEQVGEAHADADVRSAAEDMIVSCDQAEAYMADVVGKAQTQLSQRVLSGPGWSYTYRLTPKIRSFMSQLGIKPPVDGMTALQDSVLNAVAGSGITPEVLDQIMSRQAESIATMTAKIVQEVLASNKPAAPVGE